MEVNIMKTENHFKQKLSAVNLRYLRTYFVPIVTFFICVIFISCGNSYEFVDSDEEERVKSELEDRSFRQFAPSVGATKRKGVIIDFFDSEGQSISLWAQYAEGDFARNEWEIFASDYRVEKGGSEYRLIFENPQSRRILPNKCENCIETKGVSISIRNLFDSKKIEFKINDEDDNLSSPFPVFNSWTRFSEDEYFD